MKAGNLKFFSYIFFYMALFSVLYSQDEINLENIAPTFEEEVEIVTEQIDENGPKIKSKNLKKTNSNKTIVNFRALDKITAKISDINVIVGTKKKLGYLEILPKKCAFSKSDNEKGVVAYIQVKDLSDKRSDKIFVFNGWTFSSSKTLRTFDHPVYDLWVTGCENI